MDSFTEKKWFVYMGDHHEGPFSLEEIQGKMTQGQVTSESYIWADGMSDWKTMLEVPDFQPIVSGNPAASSAPAPILIEPLSDTTHDGATVAGPAMAAITPIEPTLVATPIQEVAAATALAQSSEPQATPILSTSPAAEEKTDGLESSAQAPAQKTVLRKTIRWASLGIILAGLGVAAYLGHLDPVLRSPAIQAGMDTVSDWSRPQLLALSEKLPVLEKWISPIPRMDDVSTEEFEELKAAARGGRVQGAEPRFSLALSRAESLSPAFYLASNLPDGTSFMVYVVGISDTLLNQLSFSTQVEVTLNKKLAKTQSILLASGKPLPKGEYVIYVIPSESQNPDMKSVMNSIPLTVKVPPELPKNAKILTHKTYFLGGARDTTYSARLKEFHDKLRQKATDELAEARQFAGLLNNLLVSTNTKFAILRKGKITGRQRKQWDEFHSIEWMKLQSHLDQIFIKWNPDVLQNDYFYGMIYQFILQTGQAIAKVHGLQHGFFSGNQDPHTFEIQLGEAVSSAQRSLALLESKIDQAEKIPPTPNGMPRREGL